MAQRDKTKEDLVKEIALLQKRMAEFETMGAADESVEEYLGMKGVLLARVINSIPYFIFAKDTELRTIICNEAFAAAIGKKPKELIGLTDIENGWDPELVRGNPAKGIRGFENDDRDVLLGKTVHNPRDPANTGKGVRIFDTYKIPLYSKDDKVIGILGISRDITELEKSVTDLENEKAFRESALNAIPDIFYAFDKSGKFLIWNESFKKITGYSDAELHAMKPADFFSGEDVQRIVAAVERIWKDGITKVKADFVLKSGLKVPYEFTGSVLKDGAGDSIGFSGTGRDLSEYKRLVDALVKNENKFRTLFESSRDAIMTLEPPSWKFTSGNPATVKMFMARNEADFISREPWILSPERQPDGRASAEKAKEMIETAMRDGSNLFEWMHKRINGEDFPAAVLLTRMVLDEKTMLQATVRDISERKKIEETEHKHLKEMEVFYKAAVGREERIVELKKEIEALKNKPNK